MIIVAQIGLIAEFFLMKMERTIFGLVKNVLKIIFMKSTCNTVKVGVVGSRTIIDKKYVFSVLDFYLARLLKESGVIIVSGGAKGLDKLAAEYSKERELKLIEFLPEYDKYDGKIAPIKRNQQIVDESDYLIAITTGSNGTDSTIKMAEKKNIPIKIIKI